MAKSYWLVKSEPESYSWQKFVKEGGTSWTGVRNFQARNNLRGMKRDDRVLFYHSVSEKQIVGIARVTRQAYPDPTAREGDWSAVDLAPVEPLLHPVSLQTVKSDAVLATMALLRQSRISVTPVSPKQFREVCRMAGKA